MTKNELWAIYVKKNPSFEGEGNITLSKRGLKKLFNTTWETAYFDGHEEKYTYDTGEDPSTLEVLKGIFGMR